MAVAALLVAALTAYAPRGPMGNRLSSSSSGGSGATSSSSTRRELLSGGLLAAAALALPRPAQASYAMYQASYDTFQDRKATGYVPVATNDRASLEEIQAGIARRRPGYEEKKARKGTQYCAGQTSGVSPMLENICTNIGISKADQSNTQVDAFGNMNAGAAGAQYKEYQRLRALADK